MKIGKRLAVLAVSSVTLTAMSANAQMAWGTGMAMGQQSCPYNTQVGSGASSYLEDYNDIKKSKSDEEAKLRELKKKLQNLQREMDKARDTIEDTIDSKYTSMIEEHMDNTRDCSDYKYDSIPKAKSKVKVDQDGEDLPDANAQSKLVPINGFSPKQWADVCVPGQKGGLNGDVCVNPYAAAGGDRKSPNDCKRAIGTYRKDAVDIQKVQDDISKSEDRVARYKEQLPKALREAQDNYKADHQSGTEGGVCLTCLANSSGYNPERQNTGTDWAGVAANVGVGLLATYMGYQTNKMVAQYNSDLGWPTQAYPAWGYGLPFLANGLYGALGGGIGGGAFGCAGGMGGAGFGNGYMGGMGPFGMGGGLYGNVGMNGPYGYPMGMMGSPYGGGMFNGGMGPWGMNGMGGMYPGMGGGMMVMGGLGGGYMMNGYMMGNMMGGSMMGGYPSMGGMGMMSPYGMMVSGGLGLMAGSMMGGYPGMMASGYMGMGTMSPYGMMAGGGLMASAGMMSPYGMMAGGYMGMGTMMGSMTGGYMGMGTMGMGMMMDGGLGSMQMQQAMMQMQQQQTQLYMQQYQQQMQNQMARQQTMSGLQSELYSLMYRIQQVQMGYDTTGYISGGIGGGISIGGTLGTTGTVQGVIPAPGNPAYGTGTTTVPAGVVIPAGSR